MMSKSKGAILSMAGPGQAQWVLVMAMMIWGLNVAAVKQLTGEFDAIWLATLRMIVATLALTVAVAVKRCPWPSIGPKQIAILLVCGILMVYLNQILFAEGLRRSTATNGALIMALSPLVSALLAAGMFGERMGGVRAVGVALGLCGVVAVVLSHPGARVSQASAGDLMLIGAVVSFATGGALVQKLSRQMHPLWISWAMYVMGTVLLTTQALASGAQVSLPMLFPGWLPWALILFSGVFATALSNLIWNGAIATIGVARTSVFLYLVPVFGVLFAALLLGEQLNAWHLAGFVCVMAGTWLGSRKPLKVPPVSS